MRRDLLPLSIFSLAAAVALHAMAPAFAEVPDVPEEPEVVAEANEHVAPICKPIRLGTAKEYGKVMGDLYELGATEFAMVGSGLVCGWN